MFEVISAGLETSVQELPGRIGFWEQGFPPSGPVDSWSFRLANLLVGAGIPPDRIVLTFHAPCLRHDTDFAAA